MIICIPQIIDHVCNKFRSGRHKRKFSATYNCRNNKGTFMDFNWQNSSVQVIFEKQNISFFGQAVEI